MRKKKVKTSSNYNSSDDSTMSSVSSDSSEVDTIRPMWDVRAKARNRKLSMLVLIRRNLIQSLSDKKYKSKSQNKKRKTYFWLIWVWFKFIQIQKYRVKRKNAKINPVWLLRLVIMLSIHKFDLVQLYNMSTLISRYLSRILILNILLLGN